MYTTGILLKNNDSIFLNDQTSVFWWIGGCSDPHSGLQSKENLLYGGTAALKSAKENLFKK